MIKYLEYLIVVIEMLLRLYSHYTSVNNVFPLNFLIESKILLICHDNYTFLTFHANYIKVLHFQNFPFL